MTDKVSLEALQNIHLENFLERDPNDESLITVRKDLSPRDIADIFRGSDVYYNSKDSTLVRPGEAPRTMVEEASWVEYIRAADTNHDGFLDSSEANVAVKNAGLSEDEAKEIDPQAFLKSVEDLITTRYKPIAKNLTNHRAELLFKPMLEYLKMYNRGIYVDQARHAEEVLPFNGLTKSATNVVLFLPAEVHNIFTSDAHDVPPMVGDAMAATHALNEHEARLQVILRLESAIDEGVRKGEKWALEGDFNAAVAKLSGSDQAVINKALAGKKFFDILTNADDNERGQKLLSFAKEERPGFLGIGSGNSERGVGGLLPWNWGDLSSNANFWNYTGAVNNLYASRGILSYLTNKAQVWRPFEGQVTEEMLKNGLVKKGENGKLYKLDDNASTSLQSDARETRLSIMGDGGGFANEIECHVPFLGIDCRKWGDEAKIGIPGRALEIGLAGYLGYKSIRAIGNAWELGRLKGAGEPFRVWWRSARFYKPVSFSALKEARLAAMEEAATAEKAGTALPKKKWFGGRAWGAVKKFTYDKTLGKLPGLSEAQKAQIAAAATKGPGKGIIFLTDATLVLGIVHRTDKKARAYFNPFETNYELDLDKRPDPTKPDPILSAAPQKK